MASQEQRIEKLKSSFKIVPNFPKQGIAFLDIMPIFSSPQLLTLSLDAFSDVLSGLEYNAICGLQSRGFLFGVPLAYKLHKPFIPIRKKGKLPGELHRMDYDLEYGKDTIQIQKGIIRPGNKIVIIDDVLATGGTMAAAVKLVRLCGAEVVKILILADVPFLKGIERLEVEEEVVSVFAHLE